MAKAAFEKQGHTVVPFNYTNEEFIETVDIFLANTSFAFMG